VAAEEVQVNIAELVTLVKKDGCRMASITAAFPPAKSSAILRNHPSTWTFDFQGAAAPSIVELCGHGLTTLEMQ
jgi:uncharacterized protein GlcG (DUF336 family)